jgi:peroxiredoxin
MPVPVPAAPAPPLRLPLAGGGVFDLAAETPDNFTLVVFYRGWHCPVCRGYLAQLDRAVERLSGLGVGVAAVSGNTRESARWRGGADGKLTRLRVAYGQDVASMREWGLFVSKGIKDPEPDAFGEPGIFLIRPDGTIYMAALNSMPAARPRIDDVVQAIEFFTDRSYPPRGEA